MANPADNQLPDQQVADHLPETLRELLPIIGATAIVQLIQQWGGTSVYVPTPQRLTRQHPLSTCIGYEPAQQLAEYVRGDDLAIPIGKTLASVLQRLDIAALTEQGHSAASIARRYGVTDRWVLYQRSKARDDGDLEERQGGLF